MKCNTLSEAVKGTLSIMRGVLFVLIILYSLYLEYDSPLVPSASGLAG